MAHQQRRRHPSEASQTAFDPASMKEEENVLANVDAMLAKIESSLNPETGTVDGKAAMEVASEARLLIRQRSKRLQGLGPTQQSDPMRKQDELKSGASGRQPVPPFSQHGGGSNWWRNGHMIGVIAACACFLLIFVGIVIWLALTRTAQGSGNNVSDNINSTSTSTDATHGDATHRPWVCRLPPTPGTDLYLAEAAVNKTNVAYREALFAYETNITDATYEAVIATRVKHELTWAKKAEEFYRDWKRGNDIYYELEQRRADELLSRWKNGSEAELLAMIGLEYRLQEAYERVEICPPHLGDNCTGEDKITKANVTQFMTISRNGTTLGDLWKRWHVATGRPSKADFFRWAELSKKVEANLNRTAQEAWLSPYLDDSPNFDSDMQGLISEVQPFYEELHAFVRHKLNQIYGDDVVPPNGTIPAHVLGGVDAADWSGIANLVVNDSDALDQVSLVTASMVSKKWTVGWMFQTAKSFFEHLGFPNLPDQVWKRSNMTKPQNRKVDCQASVFDMKEKDKRIKMCAEVTATDFWAIHRQLAHVYYFLAYEKQHFFLRGGPNPGFHEAVANFVHLSANQPKYLKTIGLLSSVPQNHVKSLLRTALGEYGVVSIPYAYALDQWRWNVYSGNVSEDNANQHYWNLRMKYQGIRPPVSRSADDFDPTAGSDIVNSPPISRYVSSILQYQFYEGLCRNISENIQNCTIHGKLDAGTKLWDMLKLGRSKPWPEALEMITGSRRMSAEPLLKYFEPLREWLRKENKRNGVTPGWHAP